MFLPGLGQTPFPWAPLIQVDIFQDIIIIIPHFLKVLVLPLGFYERPTSGLVFSNWKESEEDFHSYRKRQKVKIAFVFSLKQPLIEAAHSQCGERGPAEPLSREPLSASQRQVTRAFTCGCEHLCFISIYSVHLFERYVLRYQKSQREDLRVGD